MNLYLIEDNPTKAAHLPDFRAQATNDLNILFRVPDDWNKPVEASKDANRICAALLDSHGVILLDYVMDDEPFRDAASKLLEIHSDVRGRYQDLYNNTFQAEEGFKLAAAVLAVGGKLNSRILICTTAYGQLNNRAWGRLAVAPPADSIEWPNDAARFSWTQRDMEQLRKLTEGHFRAHYDKAAEGWDELNETARTTLFPHGPPHDVPFHLDPIHISESSKTADTLLAAFFNAATLPMPALDASQKLYATKGAAGRNLLSASCVCAILGITCKEIAAPCMLNVSSAGRSAGAVLRALYLFANSPQPGEVGYTWKIELSKGVLGWNCDITATGVCASEAAAKEMRRKLSRTPAQQMKEDNRPNAPGTATLALDYLSKRIDVEGPKVKFTFQFQMSKLP